MMKLKQTAWTLSLILGALVSVNLQAAPAPSVTYIFNNGQPADADQVNQNFQELANRIEEIPIGPQGETGPQGEPGPGFEQFSFDPYRHNFSSKTFTYSGDDPITEESIIAPYLSEVRTYDRTVPDQVIVTIQRFTLDTEDLVHHQKRYLTDGQGLGEGMIRRETYDVIDPQIMTSSYNYSTPFIRAANSMTVGIPWLSTGIYDFFDNRYTYPSEGQAIFHELRELLGQENITVNGVDYTNCLKIIRHQSTAVFWYCEGYGLVKRVSSNQILELLSTTP